MVIKFFSYFLNVSYIDDKYELTGCRKRQKIFNILFNNIVKSVK